MHGIFLASYVLISSLVNNAYSIIAYIHNSQVVEVVQHIYLSNGSLIIACINSAKGGEETKICKQKVETIRCLNKM